ncbi:hypothetical protein [Peribacillus sp. SCS-155]|uniref:hypothetical protein n=1 Tax=Peribacillus sedimenti TaxID=3115297 RepID=UPI003906A9DB
MLFQPSTKRLIAPKSLYEFSKNHTNLVSEAILIVKKVVSAISAIALEELSKKNFNISRHLNIIVSRIKCLFGGKVLHPVDCQKGAVYFQR